MLKCCNQRQLVNYICQGISEQENYSFFLFQSANRRYLVHLGLAKWQIVKLEVDKKLVGNTSTSTQE